VKVLECHLLEIKPLKVIHGLQESMIWEGFVFSRYSGKTFTFAQINLSYRDLKSVTTRTNTRYGIIKKGGAQTSRHRCFFGSTRLVLLFYGKSHLKC